MEIWHNPSCSKSRTALTALEAAGHAPTVRRYLDDPPSAAELLEVLDRLGLEPWQLARTKETREAGIDLPREPAHRTAWAEALAAHPRAIERPVVLTDDGGGTVARDPETLAHVGGMSLDLADDDVRAEATARLGELYSGRPVLLGPGVLAGYTTVVDQLLALGCRVLVVSTARGAGPVPEPGSCTVVEVALPPTASMTEEVRALDRFTHHLPDHAAAAIEAFDPDGAGIWHTSPFVSNDRPILGRPVTGGRPATFLALEDKMLADAVWDAAEVPRAPSRIVDLDPEALGAATHELDTELGVVWSGDARDGLNGGGNFVRWVRDEHDQRAAFAFFAPRCDRVRVMPFLDGVPCSIHGFVLPGSGTAAFRPVELATLRDVARRAFVFGGLGTWWDPPPDDREAMRDVARRVGAHLLDTHGYCGAFGIDGVLTAGGFRPTELNTRMSAGATAVAAVDARFFDLLQQNVMAGRDVTAELGIDVAALESLVPLMDARRTGVPKAIGQGVSIGEVGYDLRLEVSPDGDRLMRSDTPTGTALVAADVPSGFFCKLAPCDLLRVGSRLAELNRALMAHLDAEHGTDFGHLVAPPDLRGRG